jgi:hypothetical protein
MGGIIIGLVAAFVLSPIDWITSRLELEGLGYTIYSLTAIWIVLAPWTTTVFITVMIVCSTLPLILVKQPKRGIALLSSSLLAGTIMGITAGIFYVWGVLEGTLGQACLTGFVVGSLIEGSIAELFYRRYTSGRMPPPWVSILLGAAVGLVTGTVTSPFRPWESIFFWLVGNVVGSLAIVGGVNLAVYYADRFIAGLSAEESKGGWFK